MITVVRSAATATFIPLSAACTRGYSEMELIVPARIVMIIIEGEIIPRVATIAPSTPACL